MLASGRPVVAGAAPGSDLAIEVDGCGIAVEPENPARMADAIEQLTADPALYARCAAPALMKAVTQWDRHAVLDRFAQHRPALATASEKFTPQTGMTGRLSQSGTLSAPCARRGTPAISITLRMPPSP